MQLHKKHLFYNFSTQSEHFKSNRWMLCIQLQRESKFSFNCECLSPKIIYRTDSSNDANNDRKFCFGLADTSVKKRSRNKTGYFTHETYEITTKFTKYICQLRRSKVSFTIKYLIAFKVRGSIPAIICLTEKPDYQIC